MSTDLEVQDVQKTLAAYERKAIESGEWNGTVVEFSNDGITWSEYVFPTEERSHPVLARATVHRKGVSVPTRVTISWDESIPADEEWRGKWRAHPHALFGAAAMRAALRRAFRDVITDTAEPGEPALTAAARDWPAEIAAVKTTDELNTLHKAMKQARAVTPQLEVALRARGRALANPQPVQAATPKTEAKPDPAAKPRSSRSRSKRKPRQQQTPDTAVAAAVMDALQKQDKQHG